MPMVASHLSLDRLVLKSFQARIDNHFPCLVQIILGSSVGGAGRVVLILVVSSAAERGFSGDDGGGGCGAKRWAGAEAMFVTGRCVVLLIPILILILLKLIILHYELSIFNICVTLPFTTWFVFLGA